MKLSNFLIDMQDIGKVLVNAEQLRKYAQQADEWERISISQKEIMQNLIYRIDKLEEKLALKELKKPLTVDLFA